jgi:hypothetical protein
VMLIANGFASCLRRSYRPTREGSNAGRRRNRRCGGRPTAFRMPSNNTVRRRSPWLLVASPKPYSPRCITADHSPTVNMVRPGRGPGRKAPRRPHVPINALDLHHKLEDVLVLALRCDFLYRGRREEPHRPKPR